MIMSSLDPALIAKLLKEETERPTRGGGRRGPKADPTAQRDLLTWNKLNHHICNNTCPHRNGPSEDLDGKLNPTIPLDEAGNPIGPGSSCWNTECMDTKRVKLEGDEHFDRGTQIVCEVKGVYMCRYCFIGGWLA